MKKSQLTLGLMLSLLLMFSGCSSKKKVATYKGQQKAEWKHVYVEYENAKKQRSATVKQRDKLQKKCINKTEDGRISYSLACTKQTKELNENVKYWDDVVTSRGRIIESLNDDQRRIDAREEKERREAGAKVWSGIKTTVSVALVIGAIAWLADADKEDKNSFGFKFSF